MRYVIYAVLFALISTPVLAATDAKSYSYRPVAESEREDFKCLVTLFSAVMLARNGGNKQMADVLQGVEDFYLGRLSVREEGRVWGDDAIFASAKKPDYVTDKEGLVCTNGLGTVQVGSPKPALK